MLVLALFSLGLAGEAEDFCLGKAEDVYLCSPSSYRSDDWTKGTFQKLNPYKPLTVRVVSNQTIILLMDSFAQEFSLDIKFDGCPNGRIEIFGDNLNSFNVSGKGTLRFMSECTVQSVNVSIESSLEVDGGTIFDLELTTMQDYFGLLKKISCKTLTITTTFDFEDDPIKEIRMFFDRVYFCVRSGKYTLEIPENIITRFRIAHFTSILELSVSGFETRLVNLILPKSISSYTFDIKFEKGAEIANGDRFNFYTEDPNQVTVYGEDRIMRHVFVNDVAYYTNPTPYDICLSAVDKGSGSCEGINARVVSTHQWDVIEQYLSVNSTVSVFIPMQEREFNFTLGDLEDCNGTINFIGENTSLLLKSLDYDVNITINFHNCSARLHNGTYAFVQAFNSTVLSDKDASVSRFDLDLPSTRLLEKLEFNFFREGHINASVVFGVNISDVCTLKTVYGEYSFPNYQYDLFLEINTVTQSLSIEGTWNYFHPPILRINSTSTNKLNIVGPSECAMPSTVVRLYYPSYLDLSLTNSSFYKLIEYQSSTVFPTPYNTPVPTSHVRDSVDPEEPKSNTLTIILIVCGVCIVVIAVIVVFVVMYLRRGTRMYSDVDTDIIPKVNGYDI